MPESVHNGGEPTGFDVSDAGTLIHPRTERARKCIVITNPSSMPMFLAFKNSPDPEAPVNQAEVNKGIYLGPAGGSYELNYMNLGRCEIWAIHADAGATHHICVMSCS